LCELSFNLDDKTSPDTIIAQIRCHISGVSILTDKINTRAIRAPTPTECSEIFQKKLIIVMASETKKMASINDFRKTGIGNLMIINEVAE
jgi:hypothetical protein